jgi:hypothetical protein
VKNLGTLIVIVVILLVFGAASANLIPKAPVLVQTTDPNGSVLQATPEQANQIGFWVVFVLVNLIGAGVTLGLVFWFLGRGTSSVRGVENQPNNFLLSLDKRFHPERYADALPSGQKSDKLPEKATS